MAKRPSSSRWLQRQHKDPYVKQAQQSDYRSRAVYKLIEIDERDRLFHKGQTVIDLGAAPGSWSQYAAGKTAPGGRVIAVDILLLQPVENVFFIQGDFAEDAVLQQCLAALGGAQAALVISDMSPNLSGIKATDQARSMALAEMARDLALQVLRPGGDFLVKVFQGEGMREFQSGLKEYFQKVVLRKPRASRESSSEIYLLARSLR
jgi:23S rRNA (uridine2552-2'-O)-methyltransferase